MKKIFWNRRNALLSSGGFSGGAVAVLGVIFLLVLRFAFPNVFLTLTMPLARVGTFFAEATYGVRSGFSNAVQLTSQNNVLMKRTEALAIQNRALSDKVLSLTSLLGDSRSPATVTPGLVASVLARPPVSPYDTLVLSLGADSGVTRGMEVFGTGNVPIGVVSSVTRSFSRATLFSAPGESLAAWIGAAHTPLTISGAGAGAFSAPAPRAAQIIVGDAVYAPTTLGALPIGTVVRIDSAPAEPFVTLRIAPAVNPFTLSEVVLRATDTALLGALTCATSTAP